MNLWFAIDGGNPLTPDIKDQMKEEDLFGGNIWTNDNIQT